MSISSVHCKHQLGCIKLKLLSTAGFGVLLVFPKLCFLMVKFYRPDRSWDPPNLENGYRVSFPGDKWPGRGVDHPPPTSTEVKERVELYLYSPSGPSWHVLGRDLLLVKFYIYM